MRLGESLSATPSDLFDGAYQVRWSRTTERGVCSWDLLVANMVVAHKVIANVQEMIRDVVSGSPLDDTGQARWLFAAAKEFAFLAERYPAADPDDLP